MKGFLLLLLIAVECFAQVKPGARQIALAHSDVACGDDVFSLFNNPAGLSAVTSREIGAYYSPAPFEMKELSNAFGAYCEPTDFGNVSAGFSIYGFELYKETQVALGFGRQLFRNFSAGITAIYKNISIKNYGSAGKVLLNIGATAKISDKFSFGFAADNITRSTINDESNQIPTQFIIGANAKLAKELLINLALNKEIGYNASVMFGTEYTLIDFLRLRFGISNEPNMYSGGFGILYNFMQVDYAVSKHPDLGFTHQFGVIIRLARN